jgi:hypothetical protein
MSEDMLKVYEKVLVFANDMCGKHDHLEVAAIMTTVALGIYRTALEPEDYEAMVDAISNNRDNIKSFKPEQQLH